MFPLLPPPVLRGRGNAVLAATCDCPGLPRASRPSASGYTPGTMSSIGVEENPLKLTHCIRCGYALETLPPEGTCPECGVTYDQGTVILKAGWAGNGNLATGSTGSMIVGLVGALFWLGDAFARYRSNDQAYVIAVGLWIAITLLVELSYRFIAYRASPDGALLQCRFNRFGCLQCDVPEETTGLDDTFRRVWRWITEWGYFGIAAMASAVYRVHWIWYVVIAVGFAVRLGFELRRRRRLASAVHDPHARVLMNAARERGQQVVPTPWASIDHIRVGQFAGRRGTNRWYLTSASVKRRLKRREPINAEVHATVEQIRELKSRIAAWQAAARATRMQDTAPTSNGRSNG